MGGAIEQHHLLPLSIPTAAVVALAVAAALVWIGTHFFIRRVPSKWARALFFFVRIAIGCGALWLVFNALGRVLLLATTWSIWAPALIGAAATESVIALYTLERRTVSRRAGLVLVVSRMALVLLVVVMLVQPVFSKDVSRTLYRYLAVLLDESASMYLVDRQATISEKLRLVKVFRPEAAERPYRLDESARQLEGVRQNLAAQADWLDLLKNAAFEMLTRQLDNRRKSMKQLFDDAGKTVDEHIKAVSSARTSRLKLHPKARAGLKVVEDKLAKQVRDAIAAAAKMVATGKAEQVARQYGQLSSNVRQAERALKEVVGRLPALGLAVEEAYFQSLTDEQRAEIDQAVVQSRLAIARAVLLSQGGDTGSLIRALDKKYIVKFYKFAAQPVEADIAQWRNQPARVDVGADEVVKQSVAARSTNMAAALVKAHGDIPPEQLAGVLLLTDGRHNTRGNLDLTARRLGIQNAPVCSVLIGSTSPPPDAVITGVVAPHAVYLEDKLVIEAGVKFDGLRGKEARIQLSHDGKLIDERTVRVPSDSFRTLVALVDTPKEKGIRTYQVEVQQFEGETFEANNSRVVNVVVTDARTKLLIVEGRPRWEYRYLRNLFADRDKSVRLRYVLLNADRIEGAPKRPTIHASVAGKGGQVEATALPENEEEWLKFDVVVLGDVPPDVLGDDEIRILEKFVAERGGTLVVIAGPRYMPHAFADSPLRDILPVNFESSDETMLSGPEPHFRIALTRAGRNHVIMRQSDVAEESVRVWESLPDVYWRHPLKGTKPGATVLAYAMPEEAPDFFDPDSTAAGKAAERIRRLREEFQRKNALIAVQKFALGRVMMLSFDRTWRMRYRVGDTYHHKFWGQVLRWATAGKLQAGTDLVRLGTDRMLYYPDEPILVRAKITNADQAPLMTEDATVNVYEVRPAAAARPEATTGAAADVAENAPPVLRKKLQYVPDSGGMYEADLGSLPPDRRYRITLESDEAAKVLGAQNVKTVETEIIVAPAHSAELIELSADRGILDRLASLSGGAVAQPAKAAGLLQWFGPGTTEIVEERPYFLWNSWLLLIIIVGVVTFEWILRKKVGLI